MGSFLSFAAAAIEHDCLRGIETYGLDAVKNFLTRCELQKGERLALKALLQGEPVREELIDTRLPVDKAVESALTAPRKLVSRHPVLFCGYARQGKTALLKALVAEQSSMVAGLLDLLAWLACQAGYESEDVTGSNLLLDTERFMPEQGAKYWEQLDQLMKQNGVNGCGLNLPLTIVLVMEGSDAGMDLLEGEETRVLLASISKLCTKPYIIPVVTHGDQLNESSRVQMMDRCRKAVKKLVPHEFEVKDPSVVSCAEGNPGPGVRELNQKLRETLDELLKSEQLRHVICEMIARDLKDWCKRFLSQHKSLETESLVVRRAAFALARCYGFWVTNFPDDPKTPTWAHYDCLGKQLKAANGSPDQVRGWITGLTRLVSPEFSILAENARTRFPHRDALRHRALMMSSERVQTQVVEA